MFIEMHITDTGEIGKYVVFLYFNINLTFISTLHRIIAVFYLVLFIFSLVRKQFPGRGCCVEPDMSLGVNVGIPRK